MSLREPTFWILGGEDGRTAVPVKDVLEWARFFLVRRADGVEARRVAFTDLFAGGYVSTVFLGVDHSFRRLLWPDAPPLLFETMSFGTPQDVQRRYTTWAEAEAGQPEVVRELTQRAAAGDK